MIPFIPLIIAALAKAGVAAAPAIAGAAGTAATSLAAPAAAATGAGLMGTALPALGAAGLGMQGINAGMNMAANAPALAAAQATPNPLMQFLGSITGGDAMSKGWGQMTGDVAEGVKPWQQRTAGGLNMARGAGQMSEAMPKRQPVEPVYPTVGNVPQQGWRRLQPVPQEEVSDTLRRLFPHIYG